MTINIGIIGQGFVGGAIYNTLQRYYGVRTYDIDPLKGNTSHDDVVLNSEIVFVCIPTPMRSDGSCDIRILEEVIESSCEIIKNSTKAPVHSEFIKRAVRKKIFVIKSTVPPGTTNMLANQYRSINICFSPEFLTEANAHQDFANQERIVIGGEGAKLVKSMFRKPFPDASIIVTRPETAEMVKYFTNCFLATKVTFANEMYEICAAADIDYDKVCEYALYDKRIGKSHLAVPGPDGDLGFGGHCFPKDMEAMVYFAEFLDLNPILLKKVLDKNDLVRKNRDWEAMKGRAVSND